MRTPTSTQLLKHGGVNLCSLKHQQRPVIAQVIQPLPRFLITNTFRFLFRTAVQYLPYHHDLPLLCYISPPPPRLLTVQENLTCPQGVPNSSKKKTDLLVSTRGRFGGSVEIFELRPPSVHKISRSECLGVGRTSGGNVAC